VLLQQQRPLWSCYWLSLERPLGGVRVAGGAGGASSARVESSSRGVDEE
jgi:hypothetical protein